MKPSKKMVEDFKNKVGISDEVASALLQKKVRDVAANARRAHPAQVKIKKQNEN